MSKLEYNIFPIEPQTLEPIRYINPKDENLIDSFVVNSVFDPAKNFIEVKFLSLENNEIFTDPDYRNYKIILDGSNGEGVSAVNIDPQNDLITYGFAGSNLKILYKFFNNLYSDFNQQELFYVESISPDRTEIRLLSTRVSNEDISKITGQIESELQSSAYIEQYYLYNTNTLSSVINIKSEQFKEKIAVDIKLYEPLPTSIQPKDTISVVERIADSVAFEVSTNIIVENDVIPVIAGPNFAIEVDEQSTEPSQYYNYEELFSYEVSNSTRELNSTFREKGAELSIDYSDYTQFINFSSAAERLRNFKYKMGLIESYQTSLYALDNTAGVYQSAGISGSRDYYENLIKGILNNFDHYERHLYYESGSSSWPKKAKSNLSFNYLQSPLVADETNTISPVGKMSKPYTNYNSNSTVGLAWYNTALEAATVYDDTNYNILTNTIPSYLREDSDNDPYVMFIYMLAQHFDNLWIYTKNVSEKYNADNRLNRGVSKDLVEDLLKNFGIKLYTSNKSVEDLFKYFTVNSYDTGNEIISGSIKNAGWPSISQNDYQKEIYKRIYHNLPLLLKSKGTERGVRALIACFGIPSDILQVKLYGGQSNIDTPFYGGLEPWTGSLGKVRLDNTGSIAAGDTVSQYTSIIKDSKKYTQDIHRLEIGFSPADNINAYIVSQSAVLFPSASSFNIDNYIGDPRDVSTNTYFALDYYSKQIFANVNRYDLKDFVRFIKFFDNVIFRMVKDFVPARTVTDTGIIIKSHLLERNKVPSPTLSYTRPEYTGSISVGRLSGSHGGAYNSVGAGAVNGESSTKYFKGVQTPEGYVSARGWQGSRGPGYYEKRDESAKFDGQLKNSKIVVSDGELNRGNTFKQLDYSTVLYNLQFYRDIPSGVCIISAPVSNFIINPLITTTATQLSNLFSNASNEFTYTIDNNGNISYSTTAYNFTTGWTQYKTIDVTAVNNVTSSCTAQRTVELVACDLAAAPFVPTAVEQGQSYDIETWFTTTYNTDVDYFVNGSQIFDANNHTFSGFTEGQIIPVKVTDQHSSTCTKTVNVEYVTCALSFSEATMVVRADTTGSYYNRPYGFSGTNSETSYEFRVRDINATSVWSSWFTQIPRIYTNFYNLIKTYPAVDTIVKSAFPNFQIQFRAINNAGCQDIGDILSLVSQPITSYYLLEDTLGYGPSTYDACLEFNLVWVYVVGDPIPSSYEVLNSGIPIYADNTGTAYAPSGYYSYSGIFVRYWNGTTGQWQPGGKVVCTFPDEI